MVSRFSAALCRGLIEERAPRAPPRRGRPGFPRLYAAASLKTPGAGWPRASGGCFPRLYAAASLKKRAVLGLRPADGWFSAALCRGLIEERGASPCPRGPGSGFPRLYAAASLKTVHADGALLRVPEGFPRLYAAASLKTAPRRVPVDERGAFSAALCRGLIEETSSSRPLDAGGPFSAALCRGLIEERDARGRRVASTPRFPRLYAAASLKKAVRCPHPPPPPLFSAALCRGLIEEPHCRYVDRVGSGVFRGFMPRPH